MADIQDILNERFATATETPADTATTETTPVETPAEVVVETTPAGNEEANANDSTLTEVAEAATTDQPATPPSEETKPETKNDSPFDTLFQKLNVKSEDEILAKLSELETIKGKNTLGKLIDTLGEKGIDPLTAVTFHKLDVDKLSAKEKVAWDTKMQHPNLTDEQIDALVDEEYGDETNLAQQAKLVIAGDAAAKRLSEQKAKILDPTMAAKENEVKQKEFEQAEAKRVSEWTKTPKLKELLTNLNKIEEKVSFSTFGEDKPVNKSFNFAYTIPKEGIEKVEASLRQIAIANGLDPNDQKSIEQLKPAAENLYWLENKANVLRSLANTVASQLHKEYSLKYNNSNPNRGGGVFIDTGKKSEKDLRLEATINNL